MSLKNYVEVCKARLKNALNSFAAMPEAENFPCNTCKGEALLVKHSTYALLRSSDQPIKTTKGFNVVTTELIPCPACAGTGVDQKALTKSVLESEAA